MPSFNHLPSEIQDFSYNYHRQNKIWRVFKIIFFIFLVSVIIVSSFSYKVISSDNSLLGGIGRLPIIKQFRQLMGMENLKGELDDRINFLILGQGGPGHEGPYLTDTIIFGSLKPSTKDVALISIPRDLFLNIKNYGWHKINEVNSLGEVNKYEGGGTALTAKVIGDAFDLPIHYWLRVDFDAFEKTIDDLGGVKVCVERSFEDQNYPTDDLKVETISFAAGCQMMNGQTALKFVRSRHGTNGEGSDFARSARQQKIIVALKEKIFSATTLTSPQKIYNLFQNLKDNIQTNVALAQIPHFLKILADVDQSKIKRLVLDNSPKGLLSADISEDGAYILLPRTGNLEEIRNLAKNIFVFKNGHEWEPINVVVLNGTGVEGWARDIAGYLNSLGFDILRAGNASTTEDFEKTVIFNLKNSTRDDVIMVLKKSLNANVATLLPDFLIKQIKGYPQADFAIILGCNEKNGKCQGEEEIKK